MIDLSGMITIPFLKKSRFTGSYRGMRYVLFRCEKAEPDGQEGSTSGETVLRAVIWPEPMNYECTPEEKKHGRDFTFDREGLTEAVAWLNSEHEARHF